MIALHSNIASARAIRQLSGATRSFQLSAEKLSTGLRISRAADDAAGLQIAKDLQVNSRIHTQAVRNVNDGISLLRIAGGALEQLSVITVRLKELAEQAANGVITLKQRSSLDAEASALVAEYNRIVQTTSFNSLSLFADGLSTLSIEVGQGLRGGIDFSLASGLSRALGSGVYSSSVALPNFTNSYGVVAGDINGDGLTDIVNVKYALVSVALGNGDGTFKANIDSSGTVPFTQDGLITFDANGDGKVDLMTREVSTARSYFYHGNGDGTFRAATQIATPTTGYVRKADFNSDGFDDFILRPEIYSGLDQITVMQSNGNGTFSIVQTFAAPAQVNNTISQDFNNDGREDILVTSRTGAQLFLQDATGRFVGGAVISQFSEYGISFDANNDGNFDLLGVGPSGGAVVAFGNGNGTFKAAFSSNFAIAASRELVVNDLNADGVEDVYFATGYGVGWTTLGNSDGTFKAPVSFSQPGTFNSNAAGDFNGDGVMEMVSLVSGGTTSIFYQSTYLTSTISGLDLKTQSGAREALTSLTRQQSRIACETAALGAAESRLNSAHAVLSGNGEELAAATSRILDVDVAEETSRLTRVAILQQAARAILTQANLQPELALALLS